MSGAKANPITVFVAVFSVAAVAAVAAMAQESTTYAIRGAKIHTFVGEPIENGTVIVRDGKIAEVGTNVSAPADAQVIDASGLEVYAGLFDSISRLGLTEVGAVRATVDTTEVGDYHPQIVAAHAVHPASELIPVARANGITHAVSAPGSGGGGFGRGAQNVISGQASLIHLAGWTVEEMAIETSVGMMLSWPAIQTQIYDSATFSTKEKPYKEAKKEYEDKVVELEEWFDAARHYAQAVEKGSAENIERDLKLESLGGVIKGELPLIVFAQEQRQIKAAVEFADKQKIPMILAGGREAWKLKDVLKDKDIPVILGPTQALPGEEDEPYDKPFTNASELHAAGVRIAFATFGAADSRTLPYEAANAVAYGLPWEEGLKAITLYPAEILGVGDRLGSIEAGKIANLIVTDGDPLEITTEVKYLFINGLLTNTDNKHKQLYERYRARH